MQGAESFGHQNSFYKTVQDLHRTCTFSPTLNHPLRAANATSRVVTLCSLVHNHKEKPAHRFKARGLFPKPLRATWADVKPRNGVGPTTLPHAVSTWYNELERSPLACSPQHNCSVQQLNKEGTPQPAQNWHVPQLQTTSRLQSRSARSRPAALDAYGSSQGTYRRKGNTSTCPGKKSNHLCTEDMIFCLFFPEMESLLPRLALNLQSCYFSFPSAGLIGIHHSAPPTGHCI